jgi:imidazolonepropionase
MPEIEPLELVWTHARLATMEPGAKYGLIEDGALGVRGGRIAWVGRTGDLPLAAMRTAVVRDARGRCLTPGLVDPHTHLVYAGNRAGEFEALLEGATYPEIAQAGGGILSTVRATRAASFDSLLSAASRRLIDRLAEGVTTIEIKSGYGLDGPTEKRMLAVARELGRRFPIRVCTTYLGLHALPPEFAGDPDEYIRFVCEEALPEIAREHLADSVDAFCESIAFNPAQIARFFGAAQALGLPVKVHADQLSDGGGAALAAGFRALSADHLEYTSAEGVAALSAAGTVAVLLPGAFYTLRETTLPPVASLRAAAVPMAIATDENPGTSPLGSPLLALNFACTLFGLRPNEALAGLTRNAARALGLAHEIGTLAVGKCADFVVWEVDDPVELVHPIGARPRALVYKSGAAVLRSEQHW